MPKVADAVRRSTDRAQTRISLRVREVAELTGASPRQIHALMDQGRLRFKRVGRSIYLDPDDVQRVFGFSHESAPLPSPTPEDLALARELLG